MLTIWNSSGYWLWNNFDHVELFAAIYKYKKMMFVNDVDDSKFVKIYQLLCI